MDKKRDELGIGCQPPRGNQRGGDVSRWSVPTSKCCRKESDHRPVSSPQFDCNWNAILDSVFRSEVLHRWTSSTAVACVWEIFHRSSPNFFTNSKCHTNEAHWISICTTLCQIFVSSFESKWTCCILPNPPLSADLILVPPTLIGESGALAFAQLSCYSDSSLKFEPISYHFALWQQHIFLQPLLRTRDH